MKINYWQPFEENQFYHVYNHAAGDKNIFISNKDFLDFLGKHHKYLSDVFETLAYCLMPNHFHFIVKVKSHREIMSFSKNVVSNKSEKFQTGETDLNHFILDQYRKYFSSYSLSYNHRNKHRGQLFLKRFKRISIDQETNLKYLICYVHHNPIHHGFEKKYDAWKYSSYSLNKNQSLRNIISNEKLIMVNGIKYFDGIDDFNSAHMRFKIEKEKM